MPAIVTKTLELYWGVPFAGTIVFAGNSGETPIDLTGLKVSANLHRGTPQSPGPVVHEINSDNGLFDVSGDPEDGTAVFSLSGTDISEFEIGDYIMPVFIVDSSGDVIANGHPLIRYVQVFPSGVAP